jgi:ribosome-associated toxin RatA of RatAB toxin-antitoxin module
MIRIQRSALLPYSAEKLFDLVSDIPAYPNYLEGCAGAVILESSEQSVTARLHLKKAGISQSFSTRNQLYRPNKITLALVEGPFENLEGEWRFVTLAEDACKVSLDLTFRMQHTIAHKAGGKLIENVAGNLVNAVCLRAKTLYG